MVDKELEKELMERRKKTLELAENPPSREHEFAGPKTFMAPQPETESPQTSTQEGASTETRPAVERKPADAPKTAEEGKIVKR